MSPLTLSLGLGRVTHKCAPFTMECDGNAVVTTTIRLQFDGRLTGVRRPFDCS